PYSGATTVPNTPYFGNIYGWANSSPSGPFTYASPYPLPFYSGTLTPIPPSVTLAISVMSCWYLSGSNQPYDYFGPPKPPNEVLYACSLPIALNPVASPAIGSAASLKQTLTVFPQFYFFAPSSVGSMPSPITCGDNGMLGFSPYVQGPPTY
ncbi:MAG: hypothetical protein ACREFR_02225, partial [Limisphaerales bacterium]